MKDVPGLLLNLSTRNQPTLRRETVKLKLEVLARKPEARKCLRTYDFAGILLYTVTISLYHYMTI